MNDLLLTNVRPLGEPARDIVVQSGRIAEVGAGLRLAGGHGEVVDGGGQLAIPGLVEAHAHLLVTMREAFAVAPGIAAIRSVLLRHADADAYGRPRLECLLAGRFLRTAFDGVRWHDADASRIIQDTATELLVNLRRGTELQPINLSKELEIQKVIDLVDFDELLA